MTAPKPDTFRDTDDEARDLGRKLLAEARHGALGVAIDGAPFVSRVALAPAQDALLTLVSDLAPHTGALRATPDASLLIGTIGKGDPLAHPRITLQVRARFLDKTDAAKAAYLAVQPKALLYIDFADFHLVRLDTKEGWLNGGFGRAYRMTPDDLSPKHS
ncbi:MAG: pyridoxamine 5-phosphate oxidase [Pseudomonadota bacterium]